MTGRFVWITQEQRDWLSQAIDLLREEGRANTAARVEDVVAAWDAAPADPAEAVLEAISTEWMNTGMGNEERIDEVYNREGAVIYRRSLVLRALGVPHE